MLRLRILVAAGALCALAALPAAAQQVPGAELGQVLVSRRALEDLASRLEQTAESSSFSAAARSSARAQAVLVRTRLREGDFRVGDRISLDVQAETALTRQFVILAGREIALPGVGTLPMAGVLRTELTEHIRGYLAQYLRNPIVRAQPLIRIVMSDGVGKQGWLTIPVDISLDSVIALAGGLAGQAQINRIHIERDGEDLYGGQDLMRMISDGATPDALSMQQGDRIVVPQKAPQTPDQRLRNIQYLLQLPLSLYAIVKLLGF